MFIRNKDIRSIYLLKIRAEDVSSRYVDWLNDPEINQYLETRFKQQTLESVHDFVSNIIANDNEHLYTIRTSADDIHIGNIKVGGINPLHGVGHVSLFIGDKGSWGKGYASEAIRLISEYAFNILKLRKLSAGAYQPNIASTKAFINVGYQYDGTLKSHYLLQGKPCDLVQVCLFSSQIDF